MAGKRAFGATISYESATPGTFVPIVNVVGLKPFSLKTDIVDVTAHDSPSNYREKIAGMQDAGQCSFELNYNPDAVSHQYLIESLGSAAVESFKVTFAGSSEYFTFDGIITAFDVDAPHDGKLTASCTVEITGPVTEATAP